MYRLPSGCAGTNICRKLSDVLGRAQYIYNAARGWLLLYSKLVVQS
jgi:hypothetical protein